MLTFLQVVSFAWAIVVLPLAATLLFVAATAQGRLFAIATLLAGIAPFLGLMGHSLGRVRWRRAAVGLLVLSALIYSGIIAVTPVRSVSSQYRTFKAVDTSLLARLAPTHALSEVDQLAMGYALMVPVDPLLTLTRAQELRRVTKDVYDELNRQPGLRDLPSALPDMYASLVLPGHTSDDGFIFIPRSLDSKTPARVMVFLHGSGGNFKGYFWILSQVAEQTGSVLIAPHNGFGNWETYDTPRIIEAALRHAESIRPIDRKQLTLVGLSNGGLGVSQALVHAPQQWHAAVLISPVFDEDATRVLRGSRLQTPVFIMSGDADERIPISYVRAHAERLKSAGSTVTMLTEQGANHFLMFTHRRNVVAAMTHWLQAMPSENMKLHGQ